MMRSPDPYGADRHGGLAVGHDPVRYRDLIVTPTPAKHPPTTPGGVEHPPSLDRTTAARPWRAS